ncbi:hypothetical protein D3C73_1569600 [compost metagenome]
MKKENRKNTVNGSAKPTYTRMRPGRVFRRPMFFRTKNNGTMARKIGKVRPASIR